jgi:very-short-patch-repair endonuclease
LLNINQANNWCPYCSNPPQKLCIDECISCHNKSFASHPKSICWSNDNELIPRQVFKGADRKKFKFNCDKCPHKFEIIVKSITSKGQWCQYCSHQKLCENNNCDICFNNSFASIERSKYWSKENKLNPRQVFKSSNKKYKFDCNYCNNAFESCVSDITRNVWCPLCINKTERKLYENLKELFPTIKTQFKVEWCMNKKYLPFDFVIEERKVIIELDGPQHFKQIASWLSPEETFTIDLYKIDCANKNNFSIIRILQEDVLYDRYDWLNELTKNIEKISDENIIQNIFMNKNDEYKNYL